MIGSGVRSSFSWSGPGLHVRPLLKLLLALGLALGQLPPLTLAQTDPCPEPNDDNKSSCPLGGDVAVSWRYQDSANTYARYIDVLNGGSSVGAAKLTRWKDGDPVDIADWIESPAIHFGGQTNHVTLRARGDSFSLANNGQPLLSSRDTTFAQGDIAVGAVTWDRPVEVRYDNLLVGAPR